MLNVLKKIPKKQVFAYIFILFISFIQLYLTLENKTDYIDEPLWTVESSMGDKYITGDFKSEDWKHFYSFDHPNLYKIFTALWLRAISLNTIDLKKFSPSNDKDSGPIQNGEYYNVETKNNKSFSYAEYKKTLRLIRLSGFIIFPIFVIFLILIFENTKIPSFLKLILFAIPCLNPIFLNYFTNSGSEAFILMMLNICLYLAITHQIFLFGIAAGLALSTKFTLLITLIFPLIFALQINKNFVKKYFFSIIIAIIVFYSLNPFLWDAPIKNLFFMFTHRSKITSFQFYQFMAVNEYRYLFVRFNLILILIKEYFFNNIMISILVLTGNILSFFSKETTIKKLSFFSFILVTFLILTIPGHKDTYPRHFTVAYITLLLAAGYGFSEVFRRNK